jgi:hypothetical protein
VRSYGERLSVACHTKRPFFSKGRVQQLQLVPANTAPEHMPDRFMCMVSYEFDGSVLPLQFPATWKRRPRGTDYYCTELPVRKCIERTGEVHGMSRLLPFPGVPSDSAWDYDSGSEGDCPKHSGLLLFQLKTRAADELSGSDEEGEGCQEEGEEAAHGAAGASEGPAVRQGRHSTSSKGTQGRGRGRGRRGGGVAGRAGAAEAGARSDAEEQLQAGDDRHQVCCSGEYECCVCMATRSTAFWPARHTVHCYRPLLDKHLLTCWP